MGSDYEDEDTTRSSVGLPLDDSQLCAQVSVDGAVTIHALPLGSTIDIGRATSCDLVIDHASVSRHHAMLHVSTLQITDQNSRNGTRLRGQSLAPGVATSLAIGDSVQLGQVTLLIHHK